MSIESPPLLQLAVKTLRSPESGLEVSKILNLWANRVNETLDSIPNLNPATKTKLEDCRQICEDIISVLKSSYGLSDAIKIYVCFEKNTKILQAVGYTFSTISDSRIMKMVTAPRNIFTINEKEQLKAVKGAGKKIIEEVIKRAKHEKLTLKLTSLHSAVGFYEKMGFVQDNSCQNKIDLIPMILKVE